MLTYIVETPASIADPSVNATEGYEYSTLYSTRRKRDTYNIVDQSRTKRESQVLCIVRLRCKRDVWLRHPLEILLENSEGRYNLPLR